MATSSKNNPSASRSQTTLSSFFSPPAKDARKKRPSSPIDLTVDHNDALARKKQKKSGDLLTSEDPFPEPSMQPGPSRVKIQPTGVAEQWRFMPLSPDQPKPELPHRTVKDEVMIKQRREAFKKKLLQENNPFLRCSKSEQTRNTEIVSSGEDSDDGFIEVIEAFSHKSKSKGKKAVKGDGSMNDATTRRKKGDELGPCGLTYTPLEKQILQLKKDHPGTLLMVEVGYKYLFYGEDAQAASKELGIVSFPDRNFLTAMIPVHRRDVHLKKLLSQGYRVGIVQQTETAALKKISENRNAPFERELTHLYTAATYVDELDSVDDLERYTAPPLMCLIEEPRGGMGADERISIGMITISPSTGDVIWDEFDDTLMRTELETRLVHIKPSEMLLPERRLSKLTEKMLEHFSRPPTAGNKIRTETFNNIMSYTEAFSFISGFYADQPATSENLSSGKILATVTDFPKRVVVALAHAIKHLSKYTVANALLETKFFSKFTERSHMLLNSNTLANLEIYRNETDFTTKGSLLWILDHTKTKFGARLLKSWVGRPLVNVEILKERVDAVQEILSSNSEKLVILRELLKNAPDLAKGLCRIQYGKCTPQELAILLPAFNKIATAFPSFAAPSDVGFKSKSLNDIIYSLPKLKEPVQGLLGAISVKKASEGRKDTMWTDPDRYPVIADLYMGIHTIDVELREELKSIRKTLKRPAIMWSTVAGDQYVIEIKKDENRFVPLNWHRLSSTKTMTRYHTPEVKTKVQELARYREALEAGAHKAFLSFLEEIAQKHYAVMRDAVNKLAAADCLFSFALVALQEGYVRPEFTHDDSLEIVEGRHPMVEALRTDPFVPNTCRMGDGEPRSKIITGPNMGGKSSSVRMIALIAIMAQIGSYVPASSVKLGMLDSILTRMGASDELVRGRSTFMVEISETSDILHTATQKSLVVLDELGRGTSTYDGMAIASAVLEHLIKNIKCKTLFITHYPLVATELERKFPSDVQNLHMGFTEENRIDGTRDITFLYRLTSGIATESFGVECARVAGISEAILRVAADRSDSMKGEVEERSRRNKARKCIQLLNKCLSGDDDCVTIDKLREATDSMTSSLSTNNISSILLK